MITHKISVWRADWSAEAAVIGDIRRQVFIEEQNVPETLEWDGLDTDAIHVLGALNGEPVGTGRLLDSGQIGRLAVLPVARQQGLGSALLQELILTARDSGLPRVFLHAQIQMLDFYRRRGFSAFGADFMDAGIRHRAMALELNRH